MKNLKKYILAIAMCLCIMFTSLTGCALIVPDNSKALEKKAISVGTTVLSKQEVVDLWYNFYTENASVFYYYSEDQILEIFYKNIVLKHATMQETLALIDEGKLVYSAGDDAKVWLNVLNHFSSQVDTIEKALYKQQGVEGDNLPNRLQGSTTSSTNSEVKSYLYTEYDFTGMEDYECKYTPANNTGADLGNIKVGNNVTDEQVKDINNLLAKFIYKTAVEQPADAEEVDYISLQDLKSKIDNNAYYTSITNTTNREKAFDMYVGKLMLSAKAEGKTYNRSTALLNEIERVYISSYENYLQSMYSNYINSLVNKADSAYYTLSDEAIVARYLQLLGSDIQKYKLEENYIAVLEAKADNSLLLYRYNGEYYYFTVQHLLVGFDENVTESLANLYGNQANASIEQYNIYKSIRDNFYSQISNGSGGYLTSWEQYNNATYRDENGYDVYTYFNSSENATYKVYFDAEFVAPDPVEGEEIAEEDVQNGYYYTKADTTKVYLTKAQFDTCKKATTTVATVLNVFNTTYKATIEYLNQSNTKTLTSSVIRENLENNAAVSYVISEDLISAYMAGLETANADVIAELNNKVYTNLFMQHAFKYSKDSASLGTSLSNYVGMVISGKPDNHTVGGSTYVSEFTDKARQLARFHIGAVETTDADYAEYLEYVNLNKDYKQLGAVNYGISDHGIHMIVVNDVYKVSESAPITGNSVTAENIFGSQSNPLTEQQVKQNVANAVEKMQSIYVSSTSSQTLYEYMYELVRDELVKSNNGSASAIYTIERNRLYNEYINKQNGKNADLSDKLSYEELMDAIS